MIANYLQTNLFVGELSSKSVDELSSIVSVNCLQKPCRWVVLSMNCLDSGLPATPSFIVSTSRVRFWYDIKQSDSVHYLCHTQKIIKTIRKYENYIIWTLRSSILKNSATISVDPFSVIAFCVAVAAILFLFFPPFSFGSPRFREERAFHIFHGKSQEASGVNLLE